MFDTIKMLRRLVIPRFPECRLDFRGDHLNAFHFQRVFSRVPACRLEGTQDYIPPIHTNIRDSRTMPYAVCSGFLVNSTLAQSCSS